jgi:hypothetical protein
MSEPKTRRRMRSADAPAVMTTDDACAFLDVSEPTLRHLRDFEDLPCAYLGPQQPRYLRDDLIAWLRTRAHTRAHDGLARAPSPINGFDRSAEPR